MKTAWTVGKLAKLVGGVAAGDRATLIAGVEGLSEAGEGEISFLASKRYEHLLASTKAAAVVVGKDAKVRKNLPVIRVSNPDEAFARIAAAICPPRVVLARGIHRSAVISPGARIGKKVAIGQNVVVESGAVVDDGTSVYANCYIGHGARVGANSTLYPGVVVSDRCQIGARVIIHAGAVVGSDGFGYADMNGKKEKVPQLGIVVVGDGVEIGANVTIDRARFGQTVIGRNTKIDNLVHVAHNVRVGENCVLVAQTGIAGSSRLGRGCILAGQSGVNGHIDVGEGVTVAARAGVTKNIPAGTVVSGFPARPIRQFRREQGALRKLPELWKTVRDLSGTVAELAGKVRRKQD